jgi:2-haloacid dehalogenase
VEAALAAYTYAARACSVRPSDMMLVAVHPWDVDGAKRVGLGTVWLNRQGRQYPNYFLAPDHSLTALSELAGIIG